MHKDCIVLVPGQHSCGHKHTEGMVCQGGAICHKFFRKHGVSQRSVFAFLTPFGLIYEA